MVSSVASTQATRSAGNTDWQPLKGEAAMMKFYDLETMSKILFLQNDVGAVMEIINSFRLEEAQTFAICYSLICIGWKTTS